MRGVVSALRLVRRGEYFMSGEVRGRTVAVCRVATGGNCSPEVATGGTSVTDPPSPWGSGGAAEKRQRGMGAGFSALVTGMAQITVLLTNLDACQNR
jgi:hypothetical protein